MYGYTVMRLYGCTEITEKPKNRKIVKPQNRKTVKPQIS